MFKNLLINKTLEHVLDGNKGSNLLTALLVPLLAAKIDWVKAGRGFQCQDSDSVLEAAKVAGIVILAIWGWFIGKRKSPKPV